MGENVRIFGASSFQVQLYFFFVILSFVLIIARHKRKAFSIFVILLFYSGLFSAFGTITFNLYKIFVAIITLFFIFKLRIKILKGHFGLLRISFLVFSTTFLITVGINGDTFTLIFSQYSRYFILFSLLLIFLKLRNSKSFRDTIQSNLYELLFIQIILSLLKLFIMGPKEGLVGSITSQGGAAATLLPVLGFIFLWIYQHRRFDRKANWFLIGLILIGLAGAKRAIWFIMPALLVGFMIYENRRRFTLTLGAVTLTVASLILYFGIRLDPTLNPDNKFWGSFDANYTMNYIQSYTFGKESQSDILLGRNTTTNFLLNKFITGDITESDWFGHGLRYIRATTYEEFADLGFYTSHKGSVTGLFQTLIANGFVGVIATLLFALSMVFMIRNLRFRLVFLLFFLWEYFYYTGSLLREYSLGVMFAYIVVFADSLQLPSDRHLSAKPVAKDPVHQSGERT